MDDTLALPMLATVMPAPISFERMRRIFAKLTAPGQQERLAVDLTYLKQQAGAIDQAALHLQSLCVAQEACKLLLRKEPQLLPQLASLTAAALQQLAVQRDKEIEVSRTAAVLADTLSMLLLAVRVRPLESPTPSAADAATLAMMHDKGLLQAYVAAATVAASALSTNPPAPRANRTQRPEQVAISLINDAAHVFAAASSSLLQLWNGTADLMPIPDLLSADSLLLDTALPSATLAMALARAYAGDHAFCSVVMWHVLAASLMFTRAAVSGSTDTSFGVLARQGVYELLLLGLAVGTGLLHAECKGSSQQSLLPSMRTTSCRGDSGSGTSSSRTSSQRGSSSLSSRAGRSSKPHKGAKPGRLAVSAHHEELLHALLGVRQLAALQKDTAHNVGGMMWLTPHAVCEAGRLRLQQAYTAGLGPHYMGTGEFVVPLLLAQVEALALAPPYFADNLGVMLQFLAIMAFNCSELRGWARMQRWQQPQHHQQQQQQEKVRNWPSLVTLQSHLQLFVESLWLQLGPALLSLCRRRSGEAAGEDEEGPGSMVFTTVSGQRLGAVPPRQVFATFSEMLMTALSWQVPDEDPSFTTQLKAIVEQSPLLACSVLEAALHVSPDYMGPPAAAAAAAFSSRDSMQHASSTCLAAAAALPLLADATAAAAPQHAATSAAAMEATEATAGSGAAAAVASGSSSVSSVLQQKLFCLLVAAVKYTQFSAALTAPAGPLEPAVLGSYYNSITLLCASSSAALRVLGPPAAAAAATGPAAAAAAATGASQLSMEQQLLWLQVLGRVVLAAGQLLQQVPRFISPAASFLRVDDMFPAPKQLSLFGALGAALKVTVITLHSMLQQGGAAAAAVKAGVVAAAATPADLARLLQLAADLQEQLAPLTIAFGSAIEDTEGGEVSAAMQQLLAACQQGGLPQQLYKFGVACCAAFPQRGCCGNPGCTSLDKFTETALASQGCSGCGKAVKFCSPACHKTAWKHGHKAACAVLKQRHAAAGAAAGGAAVQEEA